jgi:osmotically-inducible protein OsmY
MNQAMTKRSMSMLITAGLALGGAAFLGCASSQPARTSETAGEYVDDTVVTTRVKTAFLNEPALKSFQINVKTYKDVVQLSGFVDSAESARLAGKVAEGVEGVRSVRNDLIVK